MPEGAEAENEKGATAVKLSEGEIYRDDFDGDGKEEEFSFTFEWGLPPQWRLEDREHWDG